jgi:V/A-type H+-transporting ATPase subunit K
MNFGMIGVVASLALAAIGSAFGAGSAGMAAAGAWKKGFIKNSPAPFLLVAFVGAPLTQTIYGFILMGALQTAIAAGQDAFLVLAAGVLGGTAMGYSAYFQGKAGAVSADAFGETKKGFANFLLVLGLIETVALFVMVFLLGVVAVA